MASGELLCTGELSVCVGLMELALLLLVPATIHPHTWGGRCVGGIPEGRKRGDTVDNSYIHLAPGRGWLRIRELQPLPFIALHLIRNQLKSDSVSDNWRIGNVMLIF